MQWGNNGTEHRSGKRMVLERRSGTSGDHTVHGLLKHYFTQIIVMSVDQKYLKICSLLNRECKTCSDFRLQVQL